jgi:hypothetical protein
LTVEDQISDAEYFLNILRDKSSRDELRPNLTAFLAISTGIIDYLLEDYNVKFGLNIPLGKILYFWRFEGAAKKQKNQLALGFINFYRGEFNTLRNGSVGKLIFGKRNIAIHRTPTSLRANFSVSIHESIHLDEILRSVRTDKNGNIRQESQAFNPQQNKQKDEDVPSPSEVEVKWFFSDYPHKEVADICREFLDLVRDFVDNVRKKFP